jgi:hypothetical protein
MWPGSSASVSRRVGAGARLPPRTFTSRGWPLSSKKLERSPLGVGLAHGQEADDEHHAALDLEGEFLVLAQAREEDGRRQHADVAVQGVDGGRT